MLLCEARLASCLALDPHHPLRTDIIMTTEHTALIAITAYGTDHVDATNTVARALSDARLISTDDGNGITSWWVAEDDRQDGSDNDSAVFVRPGRTAAASGVLSALDLTEEWNRVDVDSSFRPANDPSSRSYRSAMSLILAAAQDYADRLDALHDTYAHVEDGAHIRDAITLIMEGPEALD